MGIGGKARFLASEIRSFGWSAGEREQAQQLAARAQAVGDRYREADLRAYFGRGPA